MEMVKLLIFGILNGSDFWDTPLSPHNIHRFHALTLKVSDFIDNQSWNLLLRFTQLFPHISKEIVTLTLLVRACEDSLIWADPKEGSLCFTSCYEAWELNDPLRLGPLSYGVVLFPQDFHLCFGELFLVYFVQKIIFKSMILASLGVFTFLALKFWMTFLCIILLRNLIGIG